MAVSQQVLVPPLNFALVAPNIYRSGYPNRKNFPFLRKLRLCSVIYICDDDYTPENMQFLETEGIKLFHIRIIGNKEPFLEIDQRDIASALSQVLDVNNHPSM
jgi:tyrosine-protein phosphatase SIW14